MNNCEFIFSIKEVTPLEKIKISTTNFIFIIKTETKEGEIKLKESSTSIFKSSTKTVKKDVKFLIKLINKEKDNFIELIGLSELYIPYIQILHNASKQTFSYKKKIELSVTDSTKRTLFGSSLYYPPIVLSINVLIKIKNSTLKNNKSFPKPIRFNKCNIYNKLDKLPLSPKLPKTNKLKLNIDMGSTPKIKDKNNYLFNYTETNEEKKIISKNKSTAHKTLNSTSINKYPIYGKTHNIKSINGRTVMNRSYLNNNSNFWVYGTYPKKNKKNYIKSQLHKLCNNNYIKTENNKLDIFNENSINDDILNLNDNILTEKVEELEKNNKINNINEIESNYNEIKNNMDTTYLTEKIVNQYKNLLNFESSNQNIINTLLKIRNNLENILKLADECYRTEEKKKLKLNLIREKFYDKDYNEIKVNKQNNYIMYKDSVDIKSKEINTFNSIFNKLISKDDTKKNEDTNDVKDILQEKINLLIKCLKKINLVNKSICKFVPELNELEYSNILTKLKIFGIDECNANTFYKRKDSQLKITEEDEDKEEDM